ncbi:hypothetical protein CDAR_536261 [Caerostris darwini]|uniref:Uncharacterized protein n=1 Tax=Caerostris darwini TaxID=1538125 RepID=A0AAV4QBT0_9ARAC|nr:hypothetical protein CDAR_536261 [Caerostris darwini]
MQPESPPLDDWFVIPDATTVCWFSIIVVSKTYVYEAQQAKPLAMTCLEIPILFCLPPFFYSLPHSTAMIEFFITHQPLQQRDF